MFAYVWMFTESGISENEILCKKYFTVVITKWPDTTYEFLDFYEYLQCTFKMC